MTARARSQCGFWPAQAPQTAPSPIGCANGSPHTAHHGAAKNVIAFQQVAHSASGSSTVALQARQRGGSTPSTTARPIRAANARAGLPRAALPPLSGDDPFHHPEERRASTSACAPESRCAQSWPSRSRPAWHRRPRCSIGAPGAPTATAPPRARSIFCMTKSANGCSIGSTWSTGNLPTCSISARGTALSPAGWRGGRARRGSSWPNRRSTSPPGERRARRGRSRAGAVSRRQLRSRRQQSGPALDGRPARRAGSAAPRRSGRTGCCWRRCSAARRWSNCAPRCSRPSWPRRAGSARASRRRSNSATRPRC